jgi:ketosteroid isomerase-like protein
MTAPRALVESFQEMAGAELSGDKMIELGGMLSGAVTDDFECVMVSPYETVAYAGADGFAEAWRDWVAPYSSFSIEIDELREAGDALLMLVSQRGVTRRDGVAIEDRSGSVWRFRGEHLCRVEFYLDRDSALAAAGLR